MPSSSKGRKRGLVGLTAWVTLAVSTFATGQTTPGPMRGPGNRLYPPKIPSSTPVSPIGGRGTIISPNAQKALGSLEPKEGDDKVDHHIVSKDGKFKLDFDKVEIADLVQNISDITRKLFIIPENIHGKVTIIGPKHGNEWVTAEEAYAAFLAALDSANLSIYQMGKYYKIVEKRDARRKAVPTYEGDQPYPATEQYITRLFRLKHVDPDTVNGLMGELIGPEGLSRPFQPDLLILADQALNMHRLEKIIDQIDVPSGGDEIKIIQVAYAAASDLADKLTNIFQTKDKKPGSRGLSMSLPHPGSAPTAPQTATSTEKETAEEPTVNLTRVVADDRTNKLVVIASPRSFDRIEALIRQLDVPVPGEGQIHVYYLNNAVADQVSTVLTNLIQGANQGKRTGGSAGGAGAPAASTSIFEGQVKISPDKATNSLVIVASGSDYTNLEKVIERLDVPRRQVFVEAVIMEVNLQDEIDFGGASHYIATPTIGGQQVPIPLGAEPFQLGKGLNSLGGVSGLASLGGFLTGLQGPAVGGSLLSAAGLPSGLPSFAVLLQALQTSSDTNVLSTPHILASDNEEAEITVGQNVPFQSGFSFGGLGSLLGGAAAGAATAGLTGGAIGGLSSLPIGQIQRTNVELKLKLKPQINEGDFVRLTVDESTEEIASVDPTLGPTTSKRATKTVIVARDQETVIIGGLMQDRVVKSDNKTPLLGDIPVLGWLFRYHTSKKQKVNLLLFLTPYIIRNQSDFRTIFNRKMDERRQFVEQFYGDTVEYRVPIDYARKAGPVAEVTNLLRAEQAKLENGGSGEGSGERSVKPKNYPAQPFPLAVPPPVDGQNNPGENMPVNPSSNAVPRPESPPAAPPAVAPEAPPTEPPPPPSSSPREPGSQ